MQRQRRVQFRFAAHLQPESVRPAGIENFLHHFAQRVHLHREHPAIAPVIIVRLNRSAERRADRLHAMPQNILKPHQQRRFQSPLAGGGQHVQHLHLRAGRLLRARHHAAGGVDAKIIRAPAVDIVHAARVVNRPLTVQIMGANFWHGRAF